jgi:hypothetical protein
VKRRQGGELERLAQIDVPDLAHGELAGGEVAALELGGRRCGGGPARSVRAPFAGPNPS